MLAYDEVLRKQIIDLIRNPKTRALRSRVRDDGTPIGSAARYVWKMARVFGGREGFNLGGPIMASMMLHADARPISADLDELARAIAAHVFGSDDVFGARWRHALYGKDD